MPSQTYEVVAQAIRDKRQIFAIYNDRPRWLCPHVVGWKNGREQALFYQFDGESESVGGQIPSGDEHLGNWRCMFIDELRDVVVQGRGWYSASNHSHGPDLR